MRNLALVVGMVVAVGSVPARAAETVTYKYDAQGRLIEARAVNTTVAANGSTSTNTYDKAHNRKGDKVVRGPPAP